MDELEINKIVNKWTGTALLKMPPQQVVKAAVIDGVKLGEKETSWQWVVFFLFCGGSITESIRLLWNLIEIWCKNG